MKILLIGTLCVAAAVQFANAEEFGEAKALSPEQEALKKEADTQNEKPAVELSASKALDNLAKGIYKLGQWDEKNQQIVVMASTTFTHSNNELDDAYLNLRRSTMLKLMLRAKSEIIEQLAGAISAERVRDFDPKVGEDVALMKNEISRVAKLKLLGCTILNQAESVRQLPNGVCEVEMAILYSWSKDGEALALNMISPNDKPLLAKKQDGTKPVREWLEEKASSGSLVRWHGPRRYVDDEGNAWFIGVEPVPRSVNSRKNDRLRGIATTRADGDIALSIFADAWMEATMTDIVKENDIKGETELPDDKVTEFETSYVEKMGEKIKDLRLPGRVKLFEDTLEYKDPNASAGTGQEMYVVVRGVSAQQASKMRKIWSQAVAAAEKAEKKMVEEYKPAKQARGKGKPSSSGQTAPSAPKPKIPSSTFVD